MDFRERRRGWGAERNINARKKHLLVAFHSRPDLESHSQPRRVPLTRDGASSLLMYGTMEPPGQGLAVIHPSTYF